MGRESIDAQSLIDAGLDPTDPQVWADQYRISDLNFQLNDGGGNLPSMRGNTSTENDYAYGMRQSPFRYQRTQDLPVGCP